MDITGLFAGLSQIFGNVWLFLNATTIGNFPIITYLMVFIIFYAVVRWIGHKL